MRYDVEVIGFHGEEIKANNKDEVMEKIVPQNERIEMDITEIIITDENGNKSSILPPF